MSNSETMDVRWHDSWLVVVRRYVATSRALARPVRGGLSAIVASPMLIAAFRVLLSRSVAV